MALVKPTDGLLAFFRRITTRGKSGSGGKKDRKSFSSSDHVVQHTDFDELATLMNESMPDPDTVLSAAGLDAGAYRDIMNDAHVAGALMQRKSRTKLSRLTWKVGENDGGEITPDAQKALEIVKDQFQAIHKKRGMRNIISEILNAPLYGMTPLELFWDRLPSTDEKPNGEYRLTNILGKPFEWFGFYPDGTPGIRTSMTATFDLRPIPENRYLFVVNDGEYINPYGDRAAKRCYWPTLFKKGGIRFWSEFLEKYGSPFLFGILDDKAGEGELDEFYDDLISMVRNGVLVKKGGDAANNDIRVVESNSKGGSSDSYSRYKNAMNVEISKAILGETLTIENSESGSQAATETHKDQLRDLQDMDKEMTEESFDKLARLITDLNLGPDVAAPFAVLVNDREQEERDERIAERDSKLSKDLGVKFTSKYIQKAYELEEDDFELTATPATPPTGGSKEDGSGKEPVQDPDGGEAQGQGETQAFAEKTPETIQDGLDVFLDERLAQIQGVASPLAKALKQAVTGSQDYEELIVRLTNMKEQVPQGLFSNVFGEVLAIFDIVGTFAAEENRV